MSRHKRYPHLASCRNQTAENMKTGKYSLKGGIIALHLMKSAQVSL